MSISAILEVAIGLAFTFLLLSLITTWVNEWIAQKLRLRGKDLKKAIGNLLKDPPDYLKDPKKYLEDHPEYKPYVESFYNHPLIKSLSEQKDGEVMHLPSYIPSRTFALVAFDVLFPDENQESLANKTSAELESLIRMVPHPDTQGALLTFLKSGTTKLESLGSSAEIWFNDTMDRMSGWYKRRASLISLIVGLVLAVGLNVDTFTIADALWREPELRASVTAYVEQHVDEYAPKEEEQKDVDIPVDDLREALASLELPIGWTTEYGPKTREMIEYAKETGQNVYLAVVVGWLMKLFGWLLTGLAVSQGAPFWFDFMSKFLSVRSSGVVPKVEKGTKELEDKVKELTEELKKDLDDLKKKMTSS